MSDLRGSLGRGDRERAVPGSLKAGLGLDPQGQLSRTRPLVVYDLDGTLLDSDEALKAAFVACGVDPADITFGHVVDDECRRLGIDSQHFRDAYDDSISEPFRGVDAMLAQVGEWYLVSNKLPDAGSRELDRLEWTPRRAWFSDAFDGPKHLGVVIDWCAISGRDLIYVGDTDHDRQAARNVGAQFILAGWNPRAQATPDDTVAAVPGDVVELVNRLRRRAADP